MSERALDAIIGHSRAIANVRELIRRVAPSKLPVLIEGPTGAGKELVAAAIHEESKRCGKFVAFNVCAIGEAVFEDALFGHVRGGFTGAVSDAPGFLRAAHEGTVFFDEISGLPRVLQTKLLRAIETGVFVRVGAVEEERSNFRVIAATNEPMETLMEVGRFRRDLAHRLSAVVIGVPALTQRREDIPLLVEHFMHRAGVRVIADRAALDLLCAHSWPGNVRELRNVVERAALMGGLTVETVTAVVSRQTVKKAHALADRRHWLLEQLEAASWNPDSVAQSLGVHRTTVYRWMRETQLSGSQTAYGS